MKQMRCDVCGFTEPNELIEQKQSIKRTILLVFNPVVPDSHAVDMCENCRKLVIEQFFTMPENKLEIPGFVHQPKASHASEEE